MFSRLALKGRSVPNLVIAQRVLDKMAAAASHFIEDETGEAMVGLLVPGTNTNGIPTLYVLDTIAPDDSAVRQMHTFQQGDARQDELIWWLQENWSAGREKRRNSYGSALQAKWDVPLRYLGDWHKQPGYMIQPSGGDRMTALRWVDDDDNGMEFLLAPIVTLGHPLTTATPEANTNFLIVPQRDGTALRVDFWYIDRDIRLFLPIIPTVYPDDQLPGLSAYPWHLVQSERFNDEFSRLEADGLFTTLVLWNADNELPLEVCFMTARVGSDKVLMIITPFNYPAAEPSARVAPFIGMGAEDDTFEIFEQLWEQSEPVSNPPDWKWTPEHRLIDYIHALEAMLGIEREQPHPLETPGEQVVATVTDETLSSEDAE